MTIQEQLQAIVNLKTQYASIAQATNDAALALKNAEAAALQAKATYVAAVETQKQARETIRIAIAELSNSLMQ